jgi:hypothetical protein
MLWMDYRPSSSSLLSSMAVCCLAGRRRAHTHTERRMCLVGGGPSCVLIICLRRTGDRDQQEHHQHHHHEPLNILDVPPFIEGHPLALGGLSCSSSPPSYIIHHASFSPIYSSSCLLIYTHTYTHIHHTHRVVSQR